MRTAERVREHDSDLRWVDGLAEPCCEQGDAEDEKVAQEIEAHAEPSLDCNSHVVRSVLEVKSILCSSDEAFLVVT